MIVLYAHLCFVITMPICRIAVNNIDSLLPWPQLMKELCTLSICYRSYLFYSSSIVKFLEITMELCSLLDSSGKYSVFIHRYLWYLNLLIDYSCKIYITASNELAIYFTFIWLPLFCWYFVDRHLLWTNYLPNLLRHSSKNFAYSEKCKSITERQRLRGHPNSQKAKTNQDFHWRRQWIRKVRFDLGDLRGEQTLKVCQM